MTITHTIKPIPVNTNYISPEDAIKLIESMPLSKKSDLKNDVANLEDKVILLNLALNGKEKTQDQWIEHYNNIGKIFASASDYYQVFKTITNNPDDKNYKRILNKLQESFKDFYLMTSTRIIYKPDNLNANIIHHYSSEVISQTEKQVLIPEYQNGMRLPGLLNNKKGINYIQTIFDTKDSENEIKEVLEFISGYNEQNILLLTPEQGGRRQELERRVWFINNDHFFYIGAHDTKNSTGRSRGVEYK